MNIVITGAGQVGYNLAKYLAERGHNITVIDIDARLIDHINDHLEVKAICGHGAHPEVLQAAGIELADMLIAVTQVDEVNMIACEVASALFDVPQKIARVRSNSYLAYKDHALFQPDKLSIDFVISPETEVAESIFRSLKVPGAFAVVPFADGRIFLIGVRCTKNSPIANTPISHIPSLFPDLEMSIVGIARGAEKIIPDPLEVLRPKDEVYFVVDAEGLERALEAFGYTTNTSGRLVVLGGGNIGLYFAEQVELHYPDIRLYVIERNPQRAALIAESLKRSIVICGDALDRDILAEAGVGTAETVIAITDDDRVNTLATVLSKNMGAKKTICLTNQSSFGDLVTSMGADAVINPRVVTVSKIMEYIRSGKMHAIHSLGEKFGEVVDVNARATNNLVGRSVQEIFMELNIVIAALIRDDTVLIPSLTTLISVEDRLVLMLPASQAKDPDSFLGIE
jgi:trk system potassium uptake protein TrkA